MQMNFCGNLAELWIHKFEIHMSHAWIFYCSFSDIIILITGIVLISFCTLKSKVFETVYWDLHSCFLLIIVLLSEAYLVA